MKHVRRPHEQHQAAVRQPQCPQGFRPRLQLHGLHQRHPGRLRHARSLSACPRISGAFPKDAKGYDYDLKKAKEYYAKAVAEGAPMKRAVRDPCAVGERAERAGRAAVPERPGADRHQPEGRRQHLVEPDLGRRPSPRRRPTCGCTGSRPTSSIPRTGSARCTTASSTAPGRPRPTTRIAEVDALLRKARGLVKQEERDAALPGGDPQDHGRLPRHLDLQLHAAPGLQQAGQGPALLHRSGRARRCAGSRSRAESMARFVLRRCVARAAVAARAC